MYPISHYIRNRYVSIGGVILIFPPPRIEVPICFLRSDAIRVYTYIRFYEIIVKDRFARIATTKRRLWFFSFYR